MFTVTYTPGRQQPYTVLRGEFVECFCATQEEVDNAIARLRRWKR